MSVAVLIGLLAAHVIGDFVIQSRRDVARKHRPSVLLKHATVHAVLAYFLVGAWAALWIPVIVGASHALIDWYKTRFGNSTLEWFFKDQAAHLLVIAIIAAIGFSLGTTSAWSDPQTAYVMPFLAVATGAIVVLRVGSMVMNLALAPYLAIMRDRGGEESLPGNRGFDRGGQTIGYLERTLIYVFILAGQPGAVGFLVAAKAFLRFGEIRKSENRLEAEYIIIGTLASFAFATVASYGVVLLLALL
jgi:hypothetical protein